MKVWSMMLSVIVLAAYATSAWGGPQNLDTWKPDFDPSGAEYRCIVSNVSHPVIKGVYAGFAMRDALWEATDGKIYIDFKPFSMLGGEVEVLNMLKMGAIQGMGVSSVAATNLGPRFGLVNLPFLINSFDKLDKFVDSGPLFQHFMRAMLHQGIVGLDITGYGNYGWATTQPVSTLDQARKVKFRIAEAAVNQLLYKQWDLNTVVMPWPDVHVALKQDVITGLDHSPIVCNITKKFEVAKHFTQINYAQGLFIWIFNQAWLQSLPPDLRDTFERVVHEVCADIRAQSAAQEEEQITSAQEAGVQFHQLPEKDMAWLREQGHAVHEQYAQRINKLYPTDTYQPENYLQEVQEYMGYEQHRD
ncbi:MAG: TRAP transporter substrate-binding protein [Desulfovermiculus sp.]